MDEEPADDDRGRTVEPSSVHSRASSKAPSQKDHFLQLMFFQASHGDAAPLPEARHELVAGAYAPLRHSRPQPGDRCKLALPATAQPVRLDSPAIVVMTDLRRIDAASIDEAASIDAANRTMMNRRVRALFVVDDTRQILGIVTATDILGERPIQFAQSRGIRHGEVSVRDIMTTADRLELLDIRDIERARVGDLVATLRVAGRQHALAVETRPDATHQKTVCGIFSLTQIARQLGIPPQQTHDIARTFAEIEAAIAT